MNERYEPTEDYVEDYSKLSNRALLRVLNESPSMRTLNQLFDIAVHRATVNEFDQDAEELLVRVSDFQDNYDEIIQLETLFKSA